jgi:allantoin racemase
MPKVLVIMPFPLSDEHRRQREQQLDSVRLGPEIDFHFRSVRAAPANYVSHHDYAIADISIAEAGMRAQDEGYDAVCIDTMSDSGVAMLRSMLDIPVIGPGRATMMVALMLGEKFSILTMWERWNPLYAKTLAELDLAHKCASIRSAGITPDNRNLLAGKEEEVFPRLAETAMKCVNEDGADVILLGSTTMHQAHAYLAERLPVPVINPGPLTYKLAEVALALKLAHSRKTYPRSLAPKPGMIEAMMAAAAREQAGGSP